jgi:nicotinamidase-related amidase
VNLRLIWVMADEFNLHGGRRRKSRTALLIIDVINDMDFPGGEKLAKQALPMAKKIAALKARSKASGIAVIYVNDNFGQWQSDLRKQVAHCMRERGRGREVAKLLKPEEDDYFVLKPKSSAFFDTTLETLLRHLQTETVILTGVAADVCILFTAHDAHLRDFQIIVPSDCVASNTRAETAAALKHLKKATGASVRRSEGIQFSGDSLRKAA